MSVARAALLIVVSLTLVSGCSGCGPKGLTGNSPGDIAFSAELPEDSPARRFLGTYRYAGGEAEKIARDRAIDDAVSTMSILIRGIAKDRLLEANPIPGQLLFTGGGMTFAIVMDGRAYAAPTDGTKVKVNTITGDIMDMHYTLGPDLEQFFRDSAKGRANRFELQGNKLVMHVRVFADVLPKELVYDLTFERI